MFTMDSDRLRLPKLGTSTTVYTPGEGGAITPSDVALQQVEMVARKYAVYSYG